MLAGQIAMEMPLLVRRSEGAADLPGDAHRPVERNRSLAMRSASVALDELQDERCYWCCPAPSKESWRP
jgi:hypothetical protein